MSDALKQIIDKRIKETKGGIAIEEYMRLCLGHPEYGYYNTRDPFGASGDFTTAPEISQMFGEVIGAWIVDSWMQMGAPDPFYLIEVGPGRGTLMHDILRATNKVENFHHAVGIHLVEMSPILKSKQQDTLASYGNVTWHSDLKTLPSDAPIIVIGNEFLDALPVAQYTYDGDKWVENTVDIDKNGSYRYSKKQADLDKIAIIPRMMFPPQKGDQVEVLHELQDFILCLSKMIINQGGIGIFIDYGYNVPTYGTTLQAVMNHQFCSVLENPGECDLTAHINFAHLGTLILENNLTLYGPVSQKYFLTRLGIAHRAAQLTKNASGQQVQDIEASLNRLIGTKTKDKEMGELFKVIAFSSLGNLKLEGFA